MSEALVLLATAYFAGLVVGFFAHLIKPRG